MAFTKKTLIRINSENYHYYCALFFDLRRTMKANLYNLKTISVESVINDIGKSPTLLLGLLWIWATTIGMVS